MEYCNDPLMEYYNSLLMNDYNTLPYMNSHNMSPSQEFTNVGGESSKKKKTSKPDYNILEARSYKIEEKILKPREDVIEKFEKRVLTPREYRGDEERILFPKIKIKPRTAIKRLKARCYDEDKEHVLKSTQTIKPKPKRDPKEKFVPLELTARHYDGFKERIVETTLPLPQEKFKSYVLEARPYEGQKERILIPRVPIKIEPDAIKLKELVPRFYEGQKQRFLIANVEEVEPDVVLKRLIPRCYTGEQSRELLPTFKSKKFKPKVVISRRYDGNIERLVIANTRPQPSRTLQARCYEDDKLRFLRPRELKSNKK